MLGSPGFYLLSSHHGVFDAVVHPPLILFADIPIALETFDLPSKASAVLISGE